jgi:hypothetical protein
MSFGQSWELAKGLAQCKQKKFVVLDEDFAQYADED